MPHISVKMFPGRSEEQKREFSAKVVEAAMSVFGSSEASLSITISEIKPADWDLEVYEPEISGNESALYKRPGYGVLAKSVD